MLKKVATLLFYTLLCNGCYTVKDYMKEQRFDSRAFFPSAHFDADACQIEIDYTALDFMWEGGIITTSELKSIRDEVIQGLPYFIDDTPLHSRPGRFRIKAKMSRHQWFSRGMGIFVVPVGLYDIDAVFDFQIGSKLYSGAAKERLFYGVYYNVSPLRSIIARAVTSAIKTAMDHGELSVSMRAP